MVGHGPVPVPEHPALPVGLEHHDREAVHLTLCQSLVIRRPGIEVGGPDTQSNVPVGA